MNELGVALVAADFTDKDEQIAKDLSRTNRFNIPVNLIYPADYPKRPAILLEEVISPRDVLRALERVE